MMNLLVQFIKYSELLRHPLEINVTLIVQYINLKKNVKRKIMQTFYHAYTILDSLKIHRSNFRLTIKVHNSTTASNAKRNMCSFGCILIGTHYK